MNEHIQTAPNDPLAERAGESMESRLRRLEAALAALQDTHLMEERVVEKVMTRMEPPTAADGSPLVDAGAAMLPGVMRAVGSHFESATSPSAAPTGSLFSAHSWLLTDLVQEFRTFFAMFADFRFRTSWWSKVIPLVALILFALSWTFLHGSVLFIGSFLDYAFDFFLLIVVYKTLQREAARYRTVLPHLPPRATTS